MNREAVVFDMDGVLFDTEKRGLEMTLKAAAVVNIPITREDALRTLGLTGKATEGLYKELYGQDIDFSRFSQVWSAMMMEAAETDGMPVKPGVRPLLQWLRHRGVSMAIATATKKKTVERYLALSDMAHYFQALSCGDMVEKGKPDPEIYLLAAKKLGVEPASCIGVEDSVNGLRALRAAGMVSVMVPDLLPYTEALAPYVDHRFDSIGKVIELFS